MVGSFVYGDSFDDDYDESMGKANENAAMKKLRNDVDYGSVRVNNVTADQDRTLTIKLNSDIRTSMQHLIDIRTSMQHLDNQHNSSLDGCSTLTHLLFTPFFLGTVQVFVQYGGIPQLYSMPQQYLVLYY